MTRFPELGFYSLPGHVEDPRPIVDDARTGERLGLGSMWIAERLSTKDAPVLAGVAAATTSEMGIATGLISNLPLRHPLALASFGATMSMLTGGRFALGIGRGVDQLADATGTPRLTLKLMTEYVDTLRRLWAGEKVKLANAAFSLPGMGIGVVLDPAPPIIVAAMGDRTCDWAGRHADGVVLNSLWSEPAVRHSVEVIRNGAADAGRDPASVRVWTVLVTACEVDEETELQTIFRRMNTYMTFPFFLDALCRVNGWDRDRAYAIRDQVLATQTGDGGTLGDEGVSRELDTLRATRDLYPTEWVHAANAIGSADHCAGLAAGRLAAGADGVLFHGSAVGDLEPLLAKWPAHRPDSVGAADVNPGR